jgi:hypothetical protein
MKHRPWIREETPGAACAGWCTYKAEHSPIDRMMAAYDRLAAKAAEPVKVVISVHVSSIREVLIHLNGRLTGAPMSLAVEVTEIARDAISVVVGTKIAASDRAGTLILTADGIWWNGAQSGLWRVFSHEPSRHDLLLAQADDVPIAEFVTSL